MRADEARTWELLRALDDPDHVEFPAGFDRASVTARFLRLESQLGAAFGACGSYRGEDASFHGCVEVAAAATAGGRDINVMVSNFGDLAAVSFESFFFYEDAEIAELMHPSDATRVYGALHDLGYVVVRLDPLWEYYDGVVASLRSRADPWWSRYFDYL